MARLHGRTPAEVEALARRVADAGGRLLVVGGWVRDALRDLDAKDLDLELHGLDVDRASELLMPEGFTPPVGRQFPVWRRTRDGVDVAAPRLPDLPDGGTHTNDGSPEAIEQALRGRDLTLNAMAYDPLARRLHDPLGGRADLEARRLRAADPERFAEDPLRVLRVARLAATLDARPDAVLLATCRAIDLSSVPIERIAGELRRILLEPTHPWRAIEALREMGQLPIFAPIAELVDVPQDPEWHPEGDVFLHTGLVVDRAAELARSTPEDRREILMWGALCHDLGKPATTYTDAEQRVRSPAHDTEGERITRAWLGELRVGDALTTAVAALVRHHLAPALFVGQNAGPRAYRRLARRLAAAGVDFTDLERVARADHLGRTTPEALAGRFEAGQAFLERARAASVEQGPQPDVVRAADLMKRGVAPGPELGRLLARARTIQDDTGLRDTARILARLDALEAGDAD